MPRIVDMASIHAPSPNGSEASGRGARHGFRCSSVGLSASVTKVEERGEKDDKQGPLVSGYGEGDSRRGPC